MIPGLDLDELVSTHAMEWTDIRRVVAHHNGEEQLIGKPNGLNTPRRIPNYSTDISAAWSVKKKYRIWQLTTAGPDTVMAYYGLESERNFAVGINEEHAICVAALKSLGIELK